MSLGVTVVATSDGMPHGVMRPSEGTKLGNVTCDITISIDGYVAGPNPSLAEPLGERGERLHRWMFEDPDANAAAIDAITSAGAYVMGRNMFGPPGRGDWDEAWTGFGRAATSVGGSAGVPSSSSSL